MAPEDILAETHLLAYYYHWSERDILELPSPKRHTYVEQIAEQIRLENKGSSDGDDYDDFDGDDDFDDEG